MALQQDNQKSSASLSQWVTGIVNVESKSRDNLSYLNTILGPITENLSHYNGSSSSTCKQFRLGAGLLSLSCKKLRLPNRNHPVREKSKLKSNDGWQSWCLLKRRLRHYARTSPSQNSRHQHPNRNLWPSRILKWDLVTHYNSQLKSKTLRRC